jgi:nitrogen fixation NifU-like protein
VCFEGKFENGFLVEIAFDGVGCVISQATASLLAEHVKEKPLELILALNTQTIVALIGMDLGPTRLKCALLSLYALQEGVTTYCAQVANDAQ